MKKEILSNRIAVIAIALVALVGVLALAGGFLSNGSNGKQADASPTATATVQAALALQMAPTATPAPPTSTATPLPTETATPLPEPTATPTPEPQPLLPEPEPPTPTPAIAQAPPPTATPRAQAKPKAGGTAVLPNGVRYGDRTPNLPNRIVRISSPNIKLNAKVYEVYATKKGTWEVAEWAAGHHYNSKNPGDGGNIVLSGHNNWKGEVFRYLEFMKPGHTVTVTTLDGKEHTYVVEEVKKLKEEGATREERLRNAEVMNPTPHEQLTLITCWPYTTFTHRIVIIAKPVQ